MSSDRIRIAGDLVNWKFHNKDVKANSKVQAIYDQEWLPSMQKYFVPITNNEVYMFSQADRECTLANLVTSLMHSACSENDFVIINPGGLRTEWLPGVLQEQHFYNMFPFENSLISFDITGEELLQMLSVIQSGTLGFYPAYGLKQTVAIRNEKKIYINATLANGEPINPQSTYRGVSIDFLVKNGGDDFKNVMNKIYTLRNDRSEGDIKELLRPKLKELQSIK